jgi:hypothetical protein
MNLSDRDKQDMDLIQRALLNKKDRRVKYWPFILPWVVVWAVILWTCVPWGGK